MLSLAAYASFFEPCRSELHAARPIKLRSGCARSSSTEGAVSSLLLGAYGRLSASGVIAPRGSLASPED